MRPAAATGALVACALLLAAAARAEGGQPVSLPSPTGRLTASPPLQASPLLSELRIPGVLTTRERVLVGLSSAGEPTSVDVVQRIALHAKGDYAFAVPAPVEDVVAADDSDSEPGLRRDAILWQGFSPGHRLLAARARLRLRDAAPSLPIGVAVHARVGGAPLTAARTRSGPLVLELRVVDRTATLARSFRARGRPRELAGVLDQLRRIVEHGGAVPGYFATIFTAPEPAELRIEAPMAVRGTIRFPRGSVRGLSVRGGTVRGGTIVFRAELGDGRPLGLVVRATGAARALGPPQVRLVATPIFGQRAFRPPRGRTWTDALASGLVPADGRRLLRTTIVALLRLSRVFQYQTYLANPQSRVSARSDSAEYVYRTASAMPAVAPLRPAGRGDGWLAAVLAAGGGVLLAGGLLVAWAHS